MDNQAELKIQLCRTQDQAKIFFYVDGEPHTGLVEIRFPAASGSSAEARIHYADHFIVTENVVIDTEVRETQT
jgi:hypothetical protein